MAASVIRIDGRPYAWRDLVELRQAQTTRAAPQPTLFDLRADSRPAGQRTAAERYQTPSMFDWVPIEATRQACADRRESTRLCTCTPADCCRTVHKPLEEVL